VPIIVDASVALAWAMPDEQSVEALHLLEAMQGDRVVVPAHFRTEVANGLKVSEPRRITQSEIAQFVEQLDSLTLEIDYVGSDEVFVRVLPLAREHGLTVYDALYLELAQRRGLKLASFDRDLITAAKNVGVEVLP
jgi:predicted nucleic acid-binding protein